MSATTRPPDQDRYDLVYKLVKKGCPDREVVRQVCERFDVAPNTARADLKRLWADLGEQNEVKRQHRRDVMRLQLEELQVETREIADTARDGFSVMGPEGDPVIIQDMKTASIALSTSERIFGRLAQLDGIAESDRIKGEILKQKLLEQRGFSEEQLAAMIEAEVAQAIEAMPADRLEALLAKRRGGT